jgi:hypothetical protein
MPAPKRPAASPEAAADPESRRLLEDARRERNWKRWGPYLSERQWATVREDYSPHGECWDYFPHDHARRRAYRWGEDGLLGITDRECRLCFALALWNERDPILKERLFGLTGPEGNHGEDVKEQYFYLDSTPTHSYMKALYKYPQATFPYARLAEESRRRTRRDPEFELDDTGVFEGGRYFDVFAEYAKGDPDDVLIRITIWNRGPDPAPIHLLPTLWYRNTWHWGCTHEGCGPKPMIRPHPEHAGQLVAAHDTLGRMRFAFEADQPGGLLPDLLWTENETDYASLFGIENPVRFVKDAFHRRLVQGEEGAVNPKRYGSKVAPWYRFELPPGGRVSVRLRLFHDDLPVADPFASFDEVFAARLAEADAFYAGRIPADLGAEERRVARQSYAGLLWSKQFYHYIVEDWLKGDQSMPAPPPERWGGRNRDWMHLYSRDVLSMPDKWEYPWFAAWDLAFHMLPMSRVDADFAKQQLRLLLREWYMHPNGQIPAYEFAFGDVNPPVHAWACWRIYKTTAPRGKRDREFLASTFQKLLMNFTWWVNRKDAEGNHLFSGGFLGLDNVGVFDRSRPLPQGGQLEQADGTAWMAFYCITMLDIALELARHEPGYEDMASKFFEHFVAICDAINTLGGCGLWDEADGFYYDQLHVDGETKLIRVRSMVGLIPLFSCLVLEDEVLDGLPGFAKRLGWFLENRKDLARHISWMEHDPGGRRTDQRDPRSSLGLLALLSRERLQRVLRYLLDEGEFLSPHGIRSLSKAYERPWGMRIGGEDYTIRYVPGESDTELFGGNSNWRGPIWLPVNYLIIESLERYHFYYGDNLRVECPTGSGRLMNLKEVADELARRLASLFLPGAGGVRPCHGEGERFARDPHWKDLVLFHEYFDAETGRGLGATHQTGWTALVSRCLEQLARTRG